MLARGRVVIAGADDSSASAGRATATGATTLPTTAEAARLLAWATMPAGVLLVTLIVGP